MKKFLLITTDFPPQLGGVARYYSQLASDFPKEQIQILTMNFSLRDKIFDQEQSYEIFRELKWGKFWPHWFSFFWPIYKKIRNNKIDILLVGQVLPLGMIAYFLFKFFGIKYWVFTHGMDINLPRGSKWKTFCLKKICSSAERIISNSYYTKNLVEQILPNISFKIKVFEPYIKNLEEVSADDIYSFKKQYKLETKKIILSLGRLVARKGFQQMIKILPELKKKLNNFIYILVGKGEYKKNLQSLANSLGVEDNILFLDEVSEKMKSLLFSSCDVFVMTPIPMENGDVEGFGLVYLEANYFGKPVIGSIYGGCGEAILNKETGLLVDSLNLDQLASKVLLLLKEKEFALKLGIKGKERVRNFDFLKEKIRQVFLD